LASYNPSY